MRRAYIGRQVLSGQTLLTDHAVVVRDGDIEAVVPSEAPSLREMEAGRMIVDRGRLLTVPEDEIVARADRAAASLRASTPG